MTKYLSVRFSAKDARSYTYTYEGDEPIQPGGCVMVDTNRGTRRVEVVAVGVEPPAFPCKPISGLVQPEKAA